MKIHHYNATTTWTGNRGKGTEDYKAYERSHVLTVANKVPIEGSSDAAFRGDKTKHTPEDLLVNSISACHMLWYLHVCAVNGVVVTDYVDHAEGTMEENADGSGQFTAITLHPHVTVADPAMVEKANALHATANQMCFIARSVKFPVHHVPTTAVASLSEA